MPSNRRGRPLRGPALPPSAQDREKERSAREERAREERFDLRRDPCATYPAVRVANPLRGSRYRVHWPTYPEPEPLSCDCADFAHRGLGTCKHIEAVRLWAAEHPEEMRAAFPEGGARSSPSDSQLARLRSSLGRRPRVNPRSLRWAEPLLLG